MAVAVCTFPAELFYIKRLVLHYFFLNHSVFRQNDEFMFGYVSQTNDVSIRNISEICVLSIVGLVIRELIGSVRHYKRSLSGNGPIRYNYLPRQTFHPFFKHFR